MNRLIKYILIIISTGAGFTAAGQSFREGRSQPPPTARMNNNGMNRVRAVNKIQAAKETYMNMQLQLDEDEAERFWPLYRQYEQELADVRRLKRANNSNEMVNGTDQIKKELYYEERLVDIHKHYTDEFLKVLPPQKVSLIFKSERQFNDELIRQMGERRGIHTQNPPQGSRY